MFRRRHTPENFLTEPAPTMTREQAEQLMFIAAHFNEALQQLPPDHPTRIEIEQDQEALHRSREAGHDLANEMAKTIIN